MSSVDTAKELPTVLSLCSGYAGLERGLELAGFKHRTVAFVEIEAYAIACLANKMERGQLLPAPIWSNLKTLPVEPFRNRVDLITGGYPCQPFSAAGKRLGEEDPRHLWPYIRRHIEAIRPVRCFFENVEGHISLGLREVISDLESLGYRTTWGIFSAREVGAPHQRKRVYILADRQSVICERSKLKRGKGGKSQMSSGVRGVSGAYILGYSQSLQCNVGSDYTKNCDGQIPKFRNPSGKKHELGYSQNHGFSRGSKNIKREGSTNISERSDKDLRSKPKRSSETLAYTKSVRVQGLRPSGKQEPNTHGESELPLRESQRRKHASWQIEPRLGRVVDGCPDRVDRIRLLGNGVVPQTAAKAWITLNKRLEALND